MTPARGAVLVLACLVSAPVRAEDPPDFTGLSLEDLSRVDLVHAASRHEQGRGEAPSSVSVMTGEEMRQHGYRTLADALRALGGFYVTDDRNYSYVGVRGFGRPGDYNTRILVLMDGMRTNEPVFDATYVGREFLLDVGIIDRIEVLRGPGAAMYGNNAFFAVVNVVTRRGRQLRGGEVRGTAGAFGDVGVHVTWGTATSSGVDVTASVSASRLSGRRLYFPEFDSDAGQGLADRLDGEEAQNAFFRAAKGRWWMQGAHVVREKDVPTGSYGTLFGDPRSHTTDGTDILGAGFDGPVGGGVDATFRVHLGASRYAGTYPYDDGILLEDRARGRWWGADWNVVTTRGRHTLTAGGELVDAFRIDLDATEGGAAYLAARAPSLRWGFYAQDEVRIGRRVLASVGLRHDRYESFGRRTSPRLGLIVGPEGPTTLKALVGTSFRAPNAYELHYYEEAALEPETIRTAEVVLERSFPRGIRGAASAFWNDIDGLITLGGDASRDGLFFRNVDSIRSRGIEASLEARRRGITGRAAYTIQQSVDRATGLEITNSPRHLASLAVAAPFGGRFTAAADAQYVSARRTLAGRATSDVLRVDLNLSAHAFRSRLESALTLRNALDARYADPGSEEHVQDVIPQDGRTLAFTLAWKF